MTTVVTDTERRPPSSKTPVVTRKHRPPSSKTPVVTRKHRPPSSKTPVVTRKHRPAKKYTPYYIESQCCPPPVSVVHRMTTHCNLNCPECAVRIRDSHTKAEGDIDTKQILDEVRLLCSPPQIRRYTVSGGEPTIHQDFAELAEKIPQIVRPSIQIILATNGYLFGKDPKALRLLKHFDSVGMSLYTERDFRNTNEKEVEMVKRYCQVQNIHLSVFVAHHYKMQEVNLEKSFSCNRLFRQSAYNGKIYPCCVGPGIKNVAGVPIDKDWYFSIQNIPAPCSSCCLSSTARQNSFVRQLKKRGFSVLY
jgi:organic radical activating enzyme